MFQNTALKNHIEESSTVEIESMVIAEWNLNVSENILAIGNYKNRPTSGTAYTASSGYANETSSTTTPTWYGYTDSNVVFSRGILDSSTTPTIFAAPDEKEKLYYSLSDCFGKFRPRSGINKLRYLQTNSINFVNKDMNSRPRYYISSKDDKFKYWTSYRKDETNVERGIGKNISTGTTYFVDDASPFVVYETPVPANRIVLKMQTHVGSIDKGPFLDTNGSPIYDTFYENPATVTLSNQKTPVVWKIQYLNSSNAWIDIKSFDGTETRKTGKRIIGSDGYLELAYGLVIPDTVTSFKHIDEFISTSSLPLSPNLGDAYLITDNTTIGIYYVWNGSSWTQFTPSYAWQVNEESLTTTTPFVTELDSPKFYGTATSATDANFREFQYIKGLRVVVSTINGFNSTLDLLELSPRLVANISDKVKDYSITKLASDIGNTGIPVGQLLAAKGTLSIFDYDQSFNPNNIPVYDSLTNSISGSIIANLNSKNIQIKFYELIKNVPYNSSLYNYIIPIKTMYSDGFPKLNKTERLVSMDLRDLYFYFESLLAPPIMLRDVSLSYALSILFDSIGFSNFVFNRLVNDNEPIIKYFYIPLDTTIGEVLNDLAQSTQTAMYFDEYNNFVCMSKNRIMPTADEYTALTGASEDITLYGSIDYTKSDISNNHPTSTKLANIISLESEDDVVYNSGKVVYDDKYIQKSAITTQEMSVYDDTRSYKYKPVTLWESSGTDNLTSINGEKMENQSFVLAALPLAQDLLSTYQPYADQPNTANAVIKNNTIDFGTEIMFINKYNGYLYANGEVIKYDAIEYSITGYADNVWITSSTDYSKYYAALPFGGSMKKTGKIRIYTKPQYNLNGYISGIVENGRAQFGTEAVDHVAIPTKDNTDFLKTSNQKVFSMQSKWLFNDSYKTTTVSLKNCSGASGQKNITTDSTTGLNVGYTVKTTSNTVLGKITKITNDTTFVIDTNLSTTLSTVKLNAIDRTLEILTQDRNSVRISDGSAGTDFITEQKALYETVIKDFFNNRTGSNSQGTLQSSSLNITGPSLLSNSTNYISYTYKNLDANLLMANRFGTRLRIVGNIPTISKDTENSIQQLAYGANYIDTLSTTENGSYKITGGSGGIAVGLDTSTNKNSGYYFEICALSNNDIVDSSSDNTSIQSIPNVYFYKILARPVSRVISAQTLTNASGTISIETSTDHEFDIGQLVTIAGGGISGTYTVSDIPNSKTFTIPSNFAGPITATTVSAKLAVPVVLWSGQAPILVDDGLFAGMANLTGQKFNTVYDLGIEVDGNNDKRTFNLYINNRLVQSVTDDDPIPLVAYNQNMALFVRGGSKLMFEHVYAIADNIGYDSTATSSLSAKPFFAEERFSNEKFNKYLINPLVATTYLAGVASATAKKYNMYYDEFGTIFRECAYFNIRYDKAYPALSSRISPTLNDRQGYMVSGYTSTAYGAEFMVFNITDFSLNLDESSGNYLGIQGIAFTQQTTNNLTVDEYFTKNSNFNNYSTLNNEYIDIQNSRNNYGKNEFTISGNYLQSYSTASDLMKWLVSKIMKPKKSIGVNIFANPMIQLGDIVKFSFKQDDINQVADDDSRFVVYHIEYSRNSDGPQMKLYLSEVK